MFIYLAPNWIDFLPPPPEHPPPVPDGSQGIDQFSMMCKKSSLGSRSGSCISSRQQKYFIGLFKYTINSNCLLNL